MFQAKKSWLGKLGGGEIEKLFILRRLRAFAIPSEADEPLRNLNEVVKSTDRYFS